MPDDLLVTDPTSPPPATAEAFLAARLDARAAWARQVLADPDSHPDLRGIAAFAVADVDAHRTLLRVGPPAWVVAVLASAYDGHPDYRPDWLAEVRSAVRRDMCEVCGHAPIAHTDLTPAGLAGCYACPGGVCGDVECGTCGQRIESVPGRWIAPDADDPAACGPGPGHAPATVPARRLVAIRADGEAVPLVVVPGAGVQREARWCEERNDDAGRVVFRLDALT